MLLWENNSLQGDYSNSTLHWAASHHPIVNYVLMSFIPYLTVVSLLDSSLRYSFSYFFHNTFKLHALFTSYFNDG